MRPDPRQAMRLALDHGPGHCPPDLFAGEVAHIIRGLKVHANNISYARHVALEDSYPRLRQHLGEAQFHRAAARFLEQSHVLRGALASLGTSFVEILEEPAWRDLARAEQAWIDAFQAAEATALELTDLACLDADGLLELQICAHPAARLIELEAAEVFDWDDAVKGDGAVLLMTRPDAEVGLRMVAAVHLDLWPMLATPGPFARLLECTDATTAAVDLIHAGALIAVPSGDLA